jgi:hypothetical protein
VPSPNRDRQEDASLTRGRRRRARRHAPLQGTWCARHENRRSERFRRCARVGPLPCRSGRSGTVGCRRVRPERHLRRRWCLSRECPRRRAGLEAVGGTAVRVSICEVNAWRTVPAQPAMPGLAGQPHYVLWAAAARSLVLCPPAPRARAPGLLDPGRGTALCSQRRAALTDPISGQSDPVHTGMRARLLRSLRPGPRPGVGFVPTGVSRRFTDKPQTPIPWMISE